jgi:hypothetical protein
MKKVLLILIVTTLALSCGKTKSGTDIAQEVCDCSKKANGLPVSDPGRSKAQDDCVQQQRDAWDKVKGDKVKADEFNAVLSKCASEQIKQSVGQ